MSHKVESNVHDIKNLMYGNVDMKKCNGNFVSYCQIKTNIVDEIMLRDSCVECKFVISFWATHELIFDIYIMSCFFQVLMKELIF
jgi:hypothetical protein